MDDPKKEIYDILSTINTANVYENRPEKLISVEATPVIVFSVADNAPTYVLEKAIAFQNVRIDIDIFAKTSKLTGGLMITVQQKMIDADYRMVFNTDVEDPTGYSHVRLSFENSI